MDTLMAASIVLTYVVIWIKATTPTVALPSVNISAPVNVVKEGTVLSIHCVVSKIQTNHIVRISRQLTDDTRTLQTLSFGNYSANVIKDRGYIDVRQLPDGNTLYSLTILRVRREDQGTYICSVISQQSNRVIVSIATYVRVDYPPDPQCSSTSYTTHNYTQQRTLYLMLTCTTITGKLPVSILWQRQGEVLRKTDVITQYSDASGLSSNLITQPTSEDNGSVFTCLVIHPGNRISSCQVGPIVANTHIPPISYSPTSYPTTDLTTNLHNNGSPGEHSISLFSIPTWVLVIADSICVILIIVTTIAIIVYGLRLSRGKQGRGHFLPETQQRRNDFQVKYNRNAEPNIYEAV